MAQWVRGVAQCTGHNWGTDMGPYSTQLDGFKTAISCPIGLGLGPLEVRVTEILTPRYPWRQSGHLGGRNPSVEVCKLKIIFLVPQTRASKK